jgi:hypothetical protein
MHLNFGIGCAIVFLSGLELWLIHYEQPHDKGAAAHQSDQSRVNHAAR